MSFNVYDLGDSIITQLRAPNLDYGDLLIMFGKGAIAVSLAALFWMMLNWWTKFDDHYEMFVRKNAGYLVLRLGFVAGHVFAMSTSLGSEDDLTPIDLVWPVVSGVLGAVLLAVTYVITNAVIGRNVKLPVGGAGDVGDTLGYKVDNGIDRDELVDPRDTHVGVNIVKAGFFLAVGLTVGGVMSGSAPNINTAVASSAVFLALSLIVLVAWYFGNDRVTTRFFGYSIRAGVSQGRLPACLEAFSMLFTQGLIQSNAVAGDFRGWIPAFSGFFVTLALTLLLTYLGRILFDSIVLTNCTIADLHNENNTLVSAAVAAILPLMALLAIPVANSFALLAA